MQKKRDSKNKINIAIAIFLIIRFKISKHDTTTHELIIIIIIIAESWYDERRGASERSN